MRIATSSDPSASVIDKSGTSFTERSLSHLKLGLATFATTTTSTTTTTAGTS
jgi:hypothetical protein